MGPYNYCLEYGYKFRDPLIVPIHIRSCESEPATSHLSWEWLQETENSMHYDYTIDLSKCYIWYYMILFCSVCFILLFSFEVAFLYCSVLSRVCHLSPSEGCQPPAEITRGLSIMGVPTYPPKGNNMILNWYPPKLNSLGVYESRVDIVRKAVQQLF